MLRAGMGIIYQYALAPAVDTDAFLVLNGLVWVFSVIVYHFVKTPKAAYTNNFYPFITIELISGFIICGIVLFMTLAFKAGQTIICIILMGLEHAA